MQVEKKRNKSKVIKACLYKYENTNYTSIVYSLGTSMFSKSWATEMINEQFEFL